MGSGGIALPFSTSETGGGDWFISLPAALSIFQLTRCNLHSAFQEHIYHVIRKVTVENQTLFKFKIFDFCNLLV
jgi:hypothetical protein